MLSLIIRAHCLKKNSLNTLAFLFNINDKRAFIENRRSFGCPRLIHYSIDYFPIILGARDRVAQRVTYL